MKKDLLIFSKKMMSEKIILGVGIILLIFNISKLNFKNLSWKENQTWYINIISAVCIVLSMTLIIYDI